MKRGYTYIVTLLLICSLYFGSLYIVSKTSTSYTSTIVQDSSEVMDKANDIQVTLSETEKCTVSTRPATLEATIKKEKAVIVILVRNQELLPMRRTIREFEE